MGSTIVPTICCYEVAKPELEASEIAETKSAVVEPLDRVLPAPRTSWPAAGRTRDRLDREEFFVVDLGGGIGFAKNHLNDRNRW